MSKIEWTDETWNPATGCSRVSPGCDHCYMFTMYPRLHAMGARGYEASPDTVRLLPERLEIPKRWTRPRRVFVNSMSDLFHPDVPYPYITQVFQTMRDAPLHDFQVLTKRPGRALTWWTEHKWILSGEWPANVWLGVSVENQEWAWRIETLLKLPAPIRFVSAEPLLGPLNLSDYLLGPDLCGASWYEDQHGIERYDLTGQRLEAVDWVIVGGESGPGARPMHRDWARSLRDQCAKSDAKFFLKQLGGSNNKRGGAMAVLDGRAWKEMP